MLSTLHGFVHLILTKNLKFQHFEGEAQSNTCSQSLKEPILKHYIKLSLCNPKIKHTTLEGRGVE